MAHFPGARESRAAVTVKTPTLVRLLLRLHADYFVKVMYVALLERDADDQGLAAYRAQLSRSSDLTGVARSIARSEEGWNKSIFARPADCVTAVFRGLLGRDPETDALKSYCADLGTNTDFAALLGDIGQSEEHWRRLLGVHAESVVRATFRALLKREPDVEALAAYTRELQRTSDLSALISDISESAEHWELLLHPKRLASDLLLTDDLGTLLAEVAKSPKVWSELAALRFPYASAASDSYEQEAWVFIHAQKTGGTSLQNMLVDTFGDRQVYREHTDTLYMRSPAELAQYRIFAGHFDYTSAAYIPRRTRRLFTFLREPRQRLLSHYRFLRAHEPSSPFFKGSVKIANHLDAVDFFRAANVLMPSGFWNHLTWCVMGQRRWKDYRQRLSGLDEPSLASHLEDIRARSSKDSPNSPSSASKKIIRTHASVYLRL